MLSNYFGNAGPKTLAAFAKLCGVTPSSLVVWAKAVNPDGSLKHPSFAQAFNTVKERHDMSAGRGKS